MELAYSEEESEECYEEMCIDSESSGDSNKRDREQGDDGGQGQQKDARL